MRAFVLLCLWLLLSGFTPGQQVVALNPQVRPDNASAGLPAVDDNFTAAGYPVAGGVCAEWGHRVPCSSHYSVTRSGAVGTCVMTDGMVSLPFAANTMRNCNGTGQLIEDTRTNDALWARDMTNAAWTKVGMGTAQNAIGADGTANSASTLTATGTASSCTASCTVLQTITLGSSADTYSVYLMRVTGTGAVNVTINNLVGTTACTLITTAWTRCSVTATLVNPVFGIQMAALNDVIVVDFNQLEPGSFVTSPILTTTVPVARAADSTAVIGALNAVLTSGTASLFIQGGPPSDTGVTSGHTFIGSSSNNTRIALVSGTPGSVLFNNNVGAASPTYGTGAWNTVTTKTAGSWTTGALSAVVNNGTVNTALINPPAWGTNILFGLSAGAPAFGGYFKRDVAFSAPIPDSTLKAMTIP